jgi:hypothetical protein
MKTIKNTKNKKYVITTTVNDLSVTFDTGLPVAKKAKVLTLNKGGAVINLNGRQVNALRKIFNTELAINSNIKEVNKNVA